MAIVSKASSFVKRKVPVRKDLGPWLGQSSRHKVEKFVDPVPHWLISNVLEDTLARTAIEEVPAKHWEGWIRYDNADEKAKRTCRELRRLSTTWQKIFASLSNQSTAKYLGVSFLRANVLQPDPLLHGAGLHILEASGHLGIHLDYARHPDFSTLERRLNLVLYLNEEWHERWGGAFLFCDHMGTPVKRISPRFNTALVWEPSDTSFHGVEALSEDAPSRISVAVNYLAPARPTASRLRALYIPRRMSLLRAG